MLFNIVPFKVETLIPSIFQLFDPVRNVIFRKVCKIFLRGIDDLLAQAEFGSDDLLRIITRKPNWAKKVNKEAIRALNC